MKCWHFHPVQTGSTGAGVHLAGEEDLFAPNVDAGCCFPFAAHSALCFCDASCQTPRKAAHGIHSRGDPQGLFTEPLTPPTSPLRNEALPANQVEDFHLNQWVGFGQNKPSSPPEGAWSHWDETALLCPAFPSALGGVALGSCSSESHTESLVIPAFVPWLPPQQCKDFHVGSFCSVTPIVPLCFLCNCDAVFILFGHG